MWSLLQRSLENLLIGAAASLIMLALLSRAQTLPAGDTISAGRDDLSRTPRNTQDYAARWRQIANEFYAAHPLRDAAPSKVPALTVSQKVRGQSRLGQVSAATHRMPPAKSARSAASLASPLAAQPSPKSSASFGWHAIAASLAAGVLSLLLYRAIWPAVVAAPRQALDCSNDLRLELPSEWVRVRPTPRQRLRPIVLAGSQLMAALAVWSLVA